MIELDKVENCDMPLPDSFGKQYGWVCPVCGRGLAPWVAECPCHDCLSIQEVKTNFNPMLGFSESEYKNMHTIDVNSDEVKRLLSNRYA